jgi:hypothetical protein
MSPPFRWDEQQLNTKDNQYEPDNNHQNSKSIVLLAKGYSAYHYEHTKNHEKEL